MYKLLKTITVTMALLCTAIAGYSSSTKTYSDTIHLANDSSFQGFEYLDSQALSADVFINGENHTYLTSNKKLWVKMFKYLYHNAGVRNLVLEYGFASGYLINEYVQTGDTQLYEVLKKYSFEQHASAYKELMEFNRTLDSGEKIHIAGIDLDRGFRIAVKTMCLILPDSMPYHDSIALHIESLQGLCTYNDNIVFDKDNYVYRDDYSSRNTLALLITNFQRHEDKYRALLGEKFETFRTIVMGMKDLHYWYGLGEENTVQSYVYREMYLFNRFKEEMQSRDGKFFGQFGRCHSARSLQVETSCNWFYFKSLAHRIENWKPDSTSLRVFATGILYKNETYDIEGWEGVKDKVDSTFDILEDNRVAFYYFKSDSLLDTRLSGMFDLLILNTYGQDPNYPGVLPMYDDYQYAGGENKMYLKFFAGYQQMQLGQLKNTIQLTDYTGVPVLGIDFIMNSSTGFGGGLTYYSVLSDTDHISDSLSVILSGYGISTYYTYNIFNGFPFFDLEPKLGFGFARLKLKYEEKFSDGNGDLNRIGSRRTSVYTNPAFIIDAGINARINLAWFTIGATGGYQLDIGNSHWKNSAIVQDSPQTQLSGWYARGFIGFNF